MQGQASNLSQWAFGPQKCDENQSTDAWGYVEIVAARKEDNG